MANADHVRTLTTQALDQFEAGKPVSALVRQAHRIAVQRHDYAAQAWFMFQQRDVKSPGDDSGLIAVKAKLLALLGETEGVAEYLRQYQNWEASRTMLDDTGNIMAVSIDQIEVNVSGLEEMIARREVPPNLHSFDAGMLIQRQEKTRAQFTPHLNSLKNILARVRQHTHDYLVMTESELDSGRGESSFFDQVYTRINALLNTYAPAAAEKFVAAQDRLSVGDAEAISHALTSCRRMIKSLADELYPATGDEKVGIDGIARTMSDDAYRNRLLQYVQERVGKHKSGAVLQAVISDLGTRLNALDALASKGVHAEPSIAEAHTCVLQVYLLAGDLLSIAEETSPLMRDDESENSSTE